MSWSVSYAICFIVQEPADRGLTCVTMPEAGISRPPFSDAYPWYDSLWLSAFARARRTVRKVAPHRAREFEQAFDVFRTDPGFEARLLEGVFDEPTNEAIRRAAASVAPAQLKMHEARMFKRFVLQDHAVFSELQQRLVEPVSAAVGEPVEPCYNVLSLYGAQGVCPLHMDAPFAKWTVDLCIAQSVPWPIHFSPVVPWPEAGSYGADWQERIQQEHAGRFSSFVLQPGQALLFGGSSQWHYRDPMPDGPSGFCDLLFLHFIPKGHKELVEPANWASIFGIPELIEPRQSAS
jgi:hypothetical protein